MASEGRPFLTARWRYLAMLNYAIAPEILEPYVPAGTLLDTFEGRTFVSMVGFRYLDTRLLGLPIPFHREFEEVNLRFYVRREVDGETRRGVVFVKEIVPKRAIAWVARAVYGENFVAMPMRHRTEEAGGTLKRDAPVEYSWSHQGTWAQLGVTPQGNALPLAKDSFEEFIAEHYWGYARQRDGSTREYRVEHPPWRVWQTSRAFLEADAASLYGPEFASCLHAAPHSAFLAEGSEVAVYPGVPLSSD